MSMVTCARCRRREALGLLSGMAWLRHDDGEQATRWVCPVCSGELSDEQRRAFVDHGDVPRVD